jgi:hypothetical protein
VQNPFLTGANNPYLEANIKTAQDDTTRAYNLAQVPAQNAAAVRSGSFGNSALGEMANQDQNLLQKNLGNLANSAHMQDYQNQQQLYGQQQGFNEGQRQWNLGFGRNLSNDAYGQNMQNLTTGIGLLGTLGNYNQGDLSTATGVQNAPANYWSQFTNGANSLGGQGGQATTTQGTSSNPLLSAAGGAQLGSNLWNQWSGNNNNTSQPISAANQSNFDNWGNSSNWFGTGTGTTP